MYAVGIDVGTTSICGVAVDTQTGAVHCTASEPSHAFLHTENAWEKIQDVNRIMQTARSVLDRVGGHGAAAIGVTGQMHGIVYLDADGDAVSSLYTWQDRRGELPYSGGTYSSFCQSPSGYGNVTHFYNQFHQLVPQNAVAYCTISDYLAAKLTGSAPVMHTSNAASLGMYDLSQNQFTCAFHGEIADDYRLLGHWGSVPVSIAIGDNQASFLGAVSRSDGVLVNIGTGSQISMESDSFIVPEGLEARPFVEGRYLQVGAALCGGRAFAMLEEFFKKVVLAATGSAPENLYPVLERMLAGRSGSELIFDNRFCGTRTNPELRGSISNISADNFTPEEFTAGVLEGIVSELFQAYKQMGRPAGALVGAGNGIRKNPALIRFFESAFGLPMRIPSYTEEAAYGAALFSMLSSGLYATLEEARSILKNHKEV